MASETSLEMEQSQLLYMDEQDIDSLIHITDIILSFRLEKCKKKRNQTNYIKKKQDDHN